MPEGYNPTTETSYELVLEAGDEAYYNFGAQANSLTESQNPVLPSDGDRSPLLGIIGGLFLLAGVGVAIFALRTLKGG